ncbi:hypothetical protein LXA43DRAFT_674430 [Ganoderma leucocontextum]|nr:hypothetical protein LXA43DRAFT_674430 [Ganoderma leucocontextum]
MLIQIMLQFMFMFVFVSVLEQRHAQHARQRVTSLRWLEACLPVARTEKRFCPWSQGPRQASRNVDHTRSLVGCSKTSEPNGME